MSGKVRYIFTMRTPIIDNMGQLETEENNNYELDDCGNKISDNSGSSSFIYGAKDIPEKFRFPDGEFAININMNFNFVLQQITIQNQIKQLNYQQRMRRNNEPILVQDTADASNMDKGLRVRHRIYVQNKRNQIKNNKFLFDEIYFESPFNNYNNIDYENDYNNILDLQNNPNYYENNYNNNNINYKNHLGKGQLSDDALEYQTEEDFINYRNTDDKNVRSQNMVNSERLKNIGNIIISQSRDNNKNNYSHKYMAYNHSESYKNNDETNKGFLHFKEEGYKNNRYAQYNQLKNSENSNSNSNNTNSESGKNRFIFFNKDEYNKAYNKGKGLTEQINHNLNINVKESNSTNNKKNGNENMNENEDRNNYQLSTIKNENVNSNNSEIVEEEKKNFIEQMYDDSYKIIKN